MDLRQLWKRYQVTWDFYDRLCGGTPGDPKLVEGWINARKPKAKPADARSLEELASEVVSTLAEVDEEEETKINVFQRLNGDSGMNGLVMRMGNIRSHIKDCARVISSLTGKIEGEKSFSVRAINGVYYPPQVYWIPVLDQDGNQMTKAEGVIEQPVHFMTPQGKRSAIKVFEYVRDARLVFELWILQTLKAKAVVSVGDLETIMMYGAVHGFGPERGRGEGKYHFQIEEIEHGKKMELLPALKRNSRGPEKVAVED